MEAKEIINLIKKHHQEYAPAMEKELDDNDIVMEMGKCILCEDLLDKIDLNWRTESQQEEKQEETERLELGAYTYVAETDITVASFDISELYYNLGCSADEEGNLSKSDIVCLKIEEEGFECIVEDGDILIKDCVIEELQPLKDPLLLALKGVALPGSSVTLYDDKNNQYRLTYSSPKKMSLYKGKVIFPGDEVSWIF